MEPIPNWKMALLVLFGVLTFPIVFFYNKKRQYELKQNDLKKTLFRQMFVRSLNEK